HGRRGRRLHRVRRVVGRPLPRPGADARRLLLQPARGRAARPHRPAAAHVSAVPLLSVEDLSVEFRTRHGVVRALERVGFSIARGETVGIVGESGSGTSVTAFTVLGLPALLIAEEPTTGLDVTTQAGILDLLGDLSRTAGMATIMITHDLAVVAERCDRIVVMHAGHVVEQAPARTLFARPRHPYTARLLASTPRAGAKLADLTPIPGAVPDLRGETTPCRYRTRCERAAAVCDRPPLPREVVAPGHVVACARPL